MAILKGSLGKIPKPTAKKQDYKDLLGGVEQNTKPITAITSHTKTVSKQEQPGAVEVSEVVHKGVITDGTKVTVDGGRTINLGNFESARIGVSITVPTTLDGINDAYDMASDWLSKKLNDAVTQINTLK